MSKKEKIFQFDDTKYIKEIPNTKLLPLEIKIKLWNTKQEEDIATMEQLVEDAKLSVDLYHKKRKRQIIQ